MITVVVGRPGMGKTVYLVGQILRYSTKHKVYTNVRISLPKGDKRAQNIFFIDGLDDIVHLRTGKIVLDEVQTYLNSRNWDKLDVRFQLLLQQHRKRGLDIIGATQSIRRADVVFRELVQVFYEIRKVVSIPWKRTGIGFYILREYDPDSIESASHSYVPIGWYSLYLADPFVYRIYDTTQEYRISDPGGRREVVTYGFVPITEHKRVVLERSIEETGAIAP